MWMAVKHETTGKQQYSEPNTQKKLIGGPVFPFSLKGKILVNPTFSDSKL